MKAVNRKVLLPVVGVIFAAPFWVAASVISTYAATLANSWHTNLLLAALALSGAVMNIANGHAHSSKAGRSRDHVQSNSHTGRRGTSTFNLGY